MRLFIALDIDDAIRLKVQRFIEDMSELAPDARWVRAESLHITLKFIGEKTAAAVDEIRGALKTVSGPKMQLIFRGHGFFPSPRSARVFWIGVESGPELKQLATAVDKAMAQLGIAKEDHAFNPHLTLARGGKSGSPRWQRSDRPNAAFSRLQEKLSAMSLPEFGTMTAREFYLYESKLSPRGAQYTKIEQYELG